MSLSQQDTNFLIAELAAHLRAHPDGSNKNLIARCPICGKDGKFGIYIGKETLRKKTFMAHCFSCSYSATSLNKLLEVIGRPDLMVTQTVDLDAPLDCDLLFPLDTEPEIDDTLGVVELPDFYKPCYTHPYLQARGFTYDDFDYFPVGTTMRLNFKYDDYVIFPIIDGGDTVGYVARHTLSKNEIDIHNRKAKRSGDYPILRFRNSTENDFVKLFYNYDAVIEDETSTVIIVEGIFDVVALTRKLDLYDNNNMAVVATFGKKISDVQIYKLQAKGVSSVIIAYDGDAVEVIKQTAERLTPYYRVKIADIPDPSKDWEDLSETEIREIFDNRLKSSIEYKLSKLQEL